MEIDCVIRSKNYTKPNLSIQVNSEFLTEDYRGIRFLTEWDGGVSPISKGSAQYITDYTEGHYTVPVSPSANCAALALQSKWLVIALLVAGVGSIPQIYKSANQT
jgi:hypothetical protein